MGVSENSVPLNRMVNDYPYKMAISLGIYTLFSDKPIWQGNGPLIAHIAASFQERDGMKVMDAGEVGEIVQGGVQVGIGNLSGSSSIHLTYSNLT